jgi:PilZ domain
MTLQTFTMQRSEDRIEMRATAVLVSKHDKCGVETGITEDVSSRGVRVISASQWPLGDVILVAIPGFHFTAAARVVYCCERPDGRFGLGLEFVVASDSLELTALATTLQFSRGLAPAN